MEEDAKQMKEVRRDRLPWAEISDIEKTERLREIVKRTQALNAELRRALWDLRETATQHEHGANGKPMVAAERIDRQAPTCGSERIAAGKEWF